MAEELKLKGLMASGPEKDLEERNPPHQNIKTGNYTTQEHGPEISTLIDKAEKTRNLEGMVPVTDYTVNADLQDLNDKVKSMMTFSENKIDNGKETARICRVCGKEGSWVDIGNHIEGKHITGVSHTCNICGKTSRSRHASAAHKSMYHRQ